MVVALGLVGIFALLAFAAGAADSPGAASAFVALGIGAVFVAGIAYAEGRIEDSGYVIDRRGDTMVIGVAPTPQPTVVRWLPSRWATAGDAP